MTLAHATAGADTIVVGAWPGGAIVLGDMLPIITEALTIDGCIDVACAQPLQIQQTAINKRIFSSSAALTVSDTHFVDGHTASSGDLHSSVFEDNLASSGGAIQYAGTGLSIDGCTFINNKGGAGGGALTLNDTVSVTASTFDNNSASADGGAIMVGGTMHVARSTFFANKALAGGGIAFAVAARAPRWSGRPSAATQRRARLVAAPCNCKMAPRFRPALATCCSLPIH